MTPQSCASDSPTVELLGPTSPFQTRLTPLRRQEGSRRIITAGDPGERSENIH